MRLMVLGRVDCEGICRLFRVVSLGEMSRPYQLMISAFSSLEIAEAIGPKLLLVEKSNNQVDIFGRADFI